MIDEKLTARNREIVRGFYEGGNSNKNKGYGEMFHPEFKVTVPNFLPWGGTTNLDVFLADVMPVVSVVLDYSRCKILSSVAQDDKVVLIIDIGIAGTEQSTVISEHWQIKDDLAISLWVAYFEPQNLIDALARNAAYGRGDRAAVQYPFFRRSTGRYACFFKRP